MLVLFYMKYFSIFLYLNYFDFFYQKIDIIIISNFSNIKILHKYLL